MSGSVSAGGSEGNNLMRGRPVAPSGVVLPPIQEDVISPPNVSVHVSLASDPIDSGGGLGVMGPSHPSLGQFSDLNRQDLGQSRVRGAPGYDLLHDAASRDLCNVASSPSPSFNPTSLLFPLSDSGFASLPSSFVLFSSSPAFSLPVSSSSSAASFSSLAPAAPLPLFTLPSVLSLSSSSSAPSFPISQFSSPVFPSAAPLPSSAPLPSLPAPPLSSTPVRPPLGFSAHPSFPQAPLPSLPVSSSPLVSSVSSAPSLSSGGAPLGFPPVSSLASSSASSSSPVGDLADFQARVLGLSAEYQELGLWFVASGGSDFRSYLASYCPHLYSDFRADFASGSSRFLAALSSSASLPLPSSSSVPSSVSSVSLPSQAPVPVSSSLAPSATPFRFPAPLLPSLASSTPSALPPVFRPAPVSSAPSLSLPDWRAVPGGSGVVCGSCFVSCSPSYFCSFSFPSFRCAGSSGSSLFCFPFRSFGSGFGSGSFFFFFRSSSLFCGCFFFLRSSG